jgi:hypothetical protein
VSFIPIMFLHLDAKTRQRRYKDPNGARSSPRAVAVAYASSNWARRREAAHSDAPRVVTFRALLGEVVLQIVALRRFVLRQAPRRERDVDRHVLRAKSPSPRSRLARALAQRFPASPAERPGPKPDARAAPRWLVCLCGGFPWTRSNVNVPRLRCVRAVVLRRGRQQRQRACFQHCFLTQLKVRVHYTFEESQHEDVERVRHIKR